MAYYTYLLRCDDGSIYAGIASDLARRMNEHVQKSPKCAKYTRTHPPVALCAAWGSVDRATASRLEYRLKRLPKQRKELLAGGGGLEQVFDRDFAEGYRAVSPEEFSVCLPWNLA